MNALLTGLSLLICLGVAFFISPEGMPAILLCVGVAAVAGYFIAKVDTDRKFLFQVFIAALLVRIVIATAVFTLKLQNFFGGDAFTYDVLGTWTLSVWQGQTEYQSALARYDVGWGMSYMVGAIYGLIGRNMLAVQYVNAVIGAATAPIIFLCARHIFLNSRVARIATLFVAFYPSLVLWSSQGLKDGPMVFLLAVSMLATLKLGERITPKYMAVLLAALLGILSLRFYVFYMMVAAIVGSYIIGMSSLSAQSFARQVVVIVGMALAMTYFGVVRTASTQLEVYGSAAALQSTRSDLAQSAQSGFGKDVDVSTTGGALSTIPMGMVYLLFAPFPWQLASLRQSITLPEMVVWWVSFPVLVMGLWFTLKYRMRQALPILIFTTMLTLAYSVFQGNVGTAYRQRSQLLIFYFIFVAVGYVLVREKREDQQRLVELNKQMIARKVARAAARRTKDREMEKIADRISEKIGF